MRPAETAAALQRWGKECMLLSAATCQITHTMRALSPSLECTGAAAPRPAHAPAVALDPMSAADIAALSE